jgi:hypothetical protein
LSFEGGSWRSRGAFLPRIDDRGDAARLGAVLDMDGDGYPELVVEVTDSRWPQGEPDTAVLQRDGKTGRFRLAAHHIDSGP